jgi:beta-glucosidase
MGQEDPYIYKYGQSFVKGLQDVQNGKLNGVLASAKHFFADGAAMYGTNIASTQVISFKNFVSHNTQGYFGAVKSDVGAVMVSYNGVNYINNGMNSLYLNGVLREDIGFKGFTLSDYNDV